MGAWSLEWLYLKIGYYSTKKGGFVVGLEMVTLHLYSDFIQCVLHSLCITFTHSHTHSYTDGGGNHEGHQPAHQEQLGVQCLAQGH